METEQRAKEILSYMVEQLAEGVFIPKQRLKEMHKEICFLIDNS